jgi:hypothetical protein
MYSLKRKAIWKIIWEHIYREPFGTVGYMDISKIKVPKYLLNSHPSDFKVVTYYKRFLKTGYLDKPLVVKTKILKNGQKIVFLKDSYIRFLIVANEIDEFRRIHNVSDFSEIPEHLRYVPVKWAQ